MSTIYRAWRASFVRRWHSNPDMCHTVDPISGHQLRVALLALSLRPDLSRAALIHAITHDQGEVATGDLPHDAKVANPELRSIVEMVETAERTAQRWDSAPLPDGEGELLKLCDWLDAYMWVLRHRPRLTHRKDWRDQYTTMTNRAGALGVSEEVKALLDEAERF